MLQVRDNVSKKMRYPPSESSLTGSFPLEKLESIVKGLSSGATGAELSVYPRKKANPLSDVAQICGRGKRCTIDCRAGGGGRLENQRRTELTAMWLRSFSKKTSTWISSKLTIAEVFGNSEDEVLASKY